MSPLPLLMLTLCGLASAQVPTEFPPDAEAVTAQTFTDQIAGRSFAGVRADGTDWRLDISKDGGLAWFSKGRSRLGKWRFEGGLFCQDMRFEAPSCNELRIRGNTIFYKRNTSSEVVAMTSR